MSGGPAFLLVPPMTESSVALVLLSVIALCAVVMTATVVTTARDARRTLRRMNGLLPSCRQTLRQARTVLDSAHRTVGRVDLVVNAVSAVVADALYQVVAVRHRVNRWLHRPTNGNGSGAGSGARSFRHRRKG